MFPQEQIRLFSLQLQRHCVEQCYQETVCVDMCVQLPPLDAQPTLEILLGEMCGVVFNVGEGLLPFNKTTSSHHTQLMTAYLCVGAFCFVCVSDYSHAFSVCVYIIWCVST